MGTNQAGRAKRATAAQVEMMRAIRDGATEIPAGGVRTWRSLCGARVRWVDGDPGGPGYLSGPRLTEAGMVELARAEAAIAGRAR